MTKIRANDIVFHRPTGEEWVVCGVNEELGTLIPCGYPFPSLADVSDCELKESCELPQPEDYNQALRRHGLESYIEHEETERRRSGSGEAIESDRLFAAGASVCRL